eukprot:CAMPEP_0185726048 /NCGR_PEP_ID=MMETSP1171-20130828/2143_1 /TAXON_ID=374046 /ORGANISM="Helicotheca tamensis, Strain CCMP826" /LENGTH=181 /DNA_ID=CAMNT_0028394323 /DNA_START=200 /DNA_END=745 /DNA_ORIENTATION=-
MAVSSCHFVDYDHDDTSGSAGLFRYNDGDSCQEYSDDRTFNEGENVARVSALIATLAAALSILLITVEFCCCRFCCSRLIVGCGLITTEICQGLTFLFYGSDTYCDGNILDEIKNQEPCSPSHGSVYSIGAIIAYFLCGAIFFCTPKPTPQCSKNDIEAIDEEEYQPATPIHDPKKWTTLT